MHAAAVHLQPSKRFLFENASSPTDARSASMALVLSLLLHVPLLPLVGLWAPRTADRPRAKDVTALFDAMLEEERILPVDLAGLGSQSACADGGYAAEPSVQSQLTCASRVSGRVCKDTPDTHAYLETGELAFASADPDVDGDGGFNLANRLSPPEAVRSGSAGKPGSGLTPEEERAMRRKWFTWYRSVLERSIYSTYPKSRLESQGVRGELTFRLELAPDGSLRSLEIVRADQKPMRVALQRTLDTIDRFPSYATTGLKFFPPFTFRIPHGPDGWQATARGKSRVEVCTSAPSM